MINTQQYSFIYFIVFSFLFCGFIQELWCYLITKTRLRSYIVDIPNSRSSHTTPTPRGGGALFSFFATVSFVYLSIHEFLPWFFSVTLSVTSLVIALVGFLDDVKGLNARLRFFFQLISVVLNASAFFLYTKNNLPLALLCLVLVFWFTYSLSLINFYNFADGINGYIAIQFLVSIFTYLFYVYLNVVQKEIYLSYCLILIIPLVGGILLFLKSNFIRKSVFMGDTGSTFLGSFLSIVFLVFSIFIFKEQKVFEPNIFFTPSSMILTWVFFSQVIFLDCACMVVAKIMLQIPFSQAHKLHLYQILSRQKGLNHTKTSLLLAWAQFFLNTIFIICSKFMNNKIFFVLVFVYLLTISIVVIKKHLLSLKVQKNELLKIS